MTHPALPARCVASRPQEVALTKALRRRQAALQRTGLEHIKVATLILVLLVRDLTNKPISM